MGRHVTHIPLEHVAQPKEQVTHDVPSEPTSYPGIQLLQADTAPEVSRVQSIQLRDVI